MVLKDVQIDFIELIEPVFIQKKVKLIVARLDKIHPVISGNKIFKLHYFLQKAKEENFPCILTFGGPWSNHLAATAHACRQNKIHCVGVIRSEEPAVLSITLQQCLSDGMELKFVSREDYRSSSHIKNLVDELNSRYEKCLIIPEGGFATEGANGAALIMDKLSSQPATHVCVAIGTATTIAGLLNNNLKGSEIIGVPVLKNMTDIEKRINFLYPALNLKYLTVLHGYEFGGYAKKNIDLFTFMNELFAKHHLPTDFVYTAKMLYAIMSEISRGFFPEGSEIICLHTGGLQGNQSLIKCTLSF